MDKNQTIGLVLMSVLLIGYMFFFSPEQGQEVANQQTDSTAIVETPQVDIEQTNQDTQTEEATLDSTTQALIAEAKEVTLENEELKINLSSLGAEILSVELKNYKTYDEKPLILIDEQNSQMEMSLPTSDGSVRLDKLGFKVVSSSKNKVVFQTSVEGKPLEIIYELPTEGFQLSYAIKSNDQNKSIRYAWTDALKRTDANLEYDRRESTVNYYTTENDFDYLSKGGTSAEVTKVEGFVRWFSMKQRFFNAALITDEKFDNVSAATMAVDEQDSTTIKTLKVEASLPLASLSEGANARFYFGPNKFDINKEVTEGFEENTYLGWAVLEPISRFIILPLFDVLEEFISNYGILIIVMVFIIKMALAPLTYKSYVAQARTKVLQPEIQKIREKYPDDQSKQTQETMKLNSEFGVNPLSGCLPMLLQMPIIFALFTFFPSAIQLRNEAFLWANDLSTYDSILSLPFTIPFYGSHVSLFTLMMTASQIAVTRFSTQQTQMPAGSPINPKVMMYGMPVMFMFVLNSFPAGLTLYYVTSNLVTLLQTVVIRKFFVDNEKIRAKLEERKKNRQKQGKKGGFMQRMQEAMQAAQEQQAEQQRNKKKK